MTLDLETIPVGRRMMTAARPRLRTTARIRGRSVRVLGYTPDGREIRRGLGGRTYLTPVPRYRYREARDQRLVSVDCGGRRIAELVWCAETDEIMDVWVVSDRRRQGIATRMWRLAHSRARRHGPRHSRVRTTAGERWARAVGGHRPRWIRAKGMPVA